MPGVRRVGRNLPTGKKGDHSVRVVIERENVNGTLRFTVAINILMSCTPIWILVMRDIIDLVLCSRQENTHRRASNQSGRTFSKGECEKQMSIETEYECWTRIAHLIQELLPNHPRRIRYNFINPSTNPRKLIKISYIAKQTAKEEDKEDLERSRTDNA